MQPLSKRLSLLAFVFFTAIGLVLAGCGDDDPVSPEPDPPDDPPEVTTIADLVADDDDFSELVGLLQEEGLVDPLADTTATFTVFAPTNDAFAPYDLSIIEDQEAVGEILDYHVIENEEFTSGDLEDGGTVETLSGDELEVFIDDEGTVFVDGSQVTNADLEADNGVVHVIDRALIGNQNLANVAWFVEDTFELYQAAVDAELGDALAGAENWTVFAPNNAAFEEAEDLIADLDQDQRQEVLQYHVIADEDLQRVRSSGLLGLLAEEDGEVELETLQGEPLTVTDTDDGIVFNNGQATLDLDNLDFFAAGNNIAHLIDGVLVPPSFQEEDAAVELSTQALDLTADDSELLVTGITAMAGQTVVITTDDGDGDFTNEDVVGSVELTENLDDGSVTVDVNGADPVDHAAHISTDGTVDGVIATSETAAIYAVAEFTWDDESYVSGTETVTVDAFEILYDGSVGEDLISIDLHAVENGEIGAFVGISQEDFPVNEQHTDAVIDVLEPREGGDDSPREEAEIEETSDFFAMTHLGAAGTDANGERIPAQQPALLTTANGELAPLVGDFAEVEIEPTVADIVATSDDFETLLTAVMEADLVGALDDPEAELTVFAPNNDAFAPINTEVLLDQPELADVLGYHVIAGDVLEADDLSDGQTVETFSGDELTVNVENGEVSIEGSTVVQPDVGAANGVIHVIDRTLLGNQNIANVAWFVDETLELYNAVVDAGLADAFVNAEDWTVFGPNNAAFEEADLSGFSEEEVQDVLQYHVFAEDIVDSGGLMALLDDGGGEIEIETAQGEDLTIAQDGDQIVFNDGQATLDADNLDYFGSNGILHVIDGVLLPPSFEE